MNAPLRPCPQCGEPGAGKFCIGCGASLGRDCPQCHHPTASGASYCHHCGAAARSTQTPASSAPPVVAWIGLGVAVVALIVAIASYATDRPGPPALGSSPTPFVGQAPDISSMTPQERADRLFDRVMIASEAGKVDSVAFFAPMALQAYQLLGSLNEDARYHVGLISAITGDAVAATAQIDSIRATTANHLLATLLEYTLASLESDTPGMLQATQKFMSAYDDEMQLGRAEYLDHRTAINTFHTQNQ